MSPQLLITDGVHRDLQSEICFCFGVVKIDVSIGEGERKDVVVLFKKQYRAR
jgi:hypothetical protein